MAFNPQYAATPGRPVNLRRDIGEALGRLPIANPAIDNAFGGPAQEALPQESAMGARDRVTGAATSIANSIDPNTTSSFGQFAGGLARGFAGVQQYLQALTGQQQERAEANTDRTLNRERVIATTEAERARAESERAQADRARQAPASPTQAADNWEEVRNRPVGSPRLQINRRTGETKPVMDPTGRPLTVTAPPPPAPRAGRTTGTPSPRPAAPAKELSRQDYDLLKADGMTDAEMAAAGYTLPR